MTHIFEVSDKVNGFCWKCELRNVKQKHLEILNNANEFIKNYTINEDYMKNYTFNY